MSAATIDTSDAYLKATEIARDLNVNPATPVRWCNRGVRLSDGTLIRPKHLRLPGGIRVKREDLAAFLAAITEDRAKSPAATDATPISSRTSSKRVAKLKAELAEAGF